MREDKVRKDLEELLIADAPESDSLLDGVLDRGPSTNIEETADLRKTRLVSASAFSADAATKRFTCSARTV